MAALSNLKPETVWKHFEALCGIPHTSGHEEGIAKYIEDFAKKLGLAVRRDAVGSVVVTQPASKGCEKAPIVVLQGHMDMVGVAAPGVKHDFLKDPIRPKIKGDQVVAEGTTLGADNGIGGAIMLALMEDPKAVHPTIEHFFTVNEESGMTGAHELRSDFLKGRRLVNLDTEEFGQFYISCAGGGDSVIDLQTPREAADADAVTLLVKVGGLKGGHSGADIHLGRGAGNKILARLLIRGLAAAPVRIRRIKGGNKRNSIPDWAEALVDVPRGKADAFRAELAAWTKILQAELSGTDPGLQVAVTEAKAEGLDPMTVEASRDVIHLLIMLPQGVLSMSPEVEGLVETSTNIGTMESSDKGFRCVLLTRSAVTSHLDMVKERIRTMAEMVLATVEEPRGYPGWKPNMSSEMLKIGMATFKRLYKRDPEVKAIHAGLECGLFSEKLPGVDMVSIGPSMANVHSPAECLNIPHVAEFYALIREYLAALGGAAPAKAAPAKAAPAGKAKAPKAAGKAKAPKAKAAKAKPAKKGAGRKG